MKKVVVFVCMAAFLLLGCNNDRNQTVEGGISIGIITASPTEEISLPEITVPVFAQAEVQPQSNPMANPNRIMHVNAAAGLRVRSLPGVDGAVTGVLAHRAEVTVIGEVHNPVTIDGIQGNWVYVTSGNVEGWVFGGFLVTAF